MSLDLFRISVLHNTIFSRTQSLANRHIIGHRVLSAADMESLIGTTTLEDDRLDRQSTDSGGLELVFTPVIDSKRGFSGTNLWYCGDAIPVR